MSNFCENDGAGLTAAPGGGTLFLRPMPRLFGGAIAPALIGKAESPMETLRLDALAARQFHISAEEAAGLIMAGRVYLGGVPADKPGTPVPADSVLTLKEKARRYAQPAPAISWPRRWTCSPWIRRG